MRPNKTALRADQNPRRVNDANGRYNDPVERLLGRALEPCKKENPMSISWQKMVGAGLLMAGLLLAALCPSPASADFPGPQLSPPPLAPERPIDVGPVPAAAGCPPGGSCAYLPSIFRVRVDPRSRAYAVSLYQQDYLGTANIDPAWTGNIGTCNAGTTSQAFRNAVLRRINYYRVMAGIPAVGALNPSYNQMDQEAALMMAANQDLNHTPPDTWLCYSQAGYNGASSSNLAMGANGPEAISLYMNDGGVSSLGHRRWVLYPQTQEMGTGDIDAPGSWMSVTNAMKSWDTHIWDARPATLDPFVAWPPAAYIPYPVVYPVWSFSVANANFSNASVEVTSGGLPVTVTVSRPPNGYGENTLAFKACNCSTWPNPGADRAYRVTIRNVLLGGVLCDYSYTVTIIDPAR